LNKKLAEDILSLTNDEILRVVDLALRRVVDNGMDNYTQNEQDIFNKLREIKMVHGAGKYG